MSETRTSEWGLRVTTLSVEGDEGGEVETTGRVDDGIVVLSTTGIKGDERVC